MSRRRIRSSRLLRNAESQNRKQFLLFSGATILIIVLLLVFSGAILNLFGSVIFGIKGDDNESNTTTVSTEYLTPPELEIGYSATPSASIDVRGIADYEEGRIQLYVNGREAETLELDGDTEFTFTDIGLQNGENKLAVSYANDEGESAQSQEYSIARVSDKPTIELLSPSNGAAFSKADRNITVSGKTETDNRVTVNGFRAVTDNDGNFSYLLELKNGDNQISIAARNQAGIETSEEITVTYQE